MPELTAVTVIQVRAVLPSSVRMLTVASFVNVLSAPLSVRVLSAPQEQLLSMTTSYHAPVSAA